LFIKTLLFKKATIVFANINIPNGEVEKQVKKALGTSKSLFYLLCLY